MPKKVDRAIKRIKESANVDEGSAIAIAKSRGIVKQKGRHLAAGPKIKRKRKERSKQS